MTEYDHTFATFKVRPERMAEVRSQAARIRNNINRYKTVAAVFPGMPWYVVGILHSMECDLDFTKHLHNGDSLKRRTVQEPAGRPVEGNPPFTWNESAIDALRYDHFDKITDWSPGSILVAFEKYNGGGYRRRGVPSPYLWSFTDQYRSGKYTADGKYNPLAVSQQCGCAPLLRELISA